MIRHRHLASLLRILLSTAGIVSLLSFHVASAQTQPQNVSDEAARGLSLYQSGDLQGALKVLRERVKISAGDSDAWHYLGLASIKAGDFKGAREAFGMAVKLRPDFLAARTGFAYSFLLAGLLKEALREAERILEQNRQSDEAHYIISAVSLKQGNYLKALKEADAALELQPNFQAALNLKKPPGRFNSSRPLKTGSLYLSCRWLSTRSGSRRGRTARKGAFNNGQFPIRICYGAEGDRTPDLMNAIHALSQLSYGPVCMPRRARRGKIK